MNYTITMCGRYALYGPVSRLREQFEVDFDDLDFQPHYNIAPMQFAPVIRQIDGERHAAQLRWGLLPSWAKDSTIAPRLFNARAETAAEKPAFRAAFRSRRCLVPANGFYEWAPTTDKRKQPYFVHLASDAPMALAGLWEHWTSSEGENVVTFTILTTESNLLLSTIHPRMPVILPPETWSLWLHAARTPAQLAPLLRAHPAETIRLRPVSTRVGNVRVDDATLVEPVPASAGTFPE